MRLKPPALPCWMGEGHAPGVRAKPRLVRRSCFSHGPDAVRESAFSSHPPFVPSALHVPPLHERSCVRATALLLWTSYRFTASPILLKQAHRSQREKGRSSAKPACGRAAANDCHKGLLCFVYHAMMLRRQPSSATAVLRRPLLRGWGQLLVASGRGRGSSVASTVSSSSSSSSSSLSVALAAGWRRGDRRGIASTAGVCRSWEAGRPWRTQEGGALLSLAQGPDDVSPVVRLLYR